MNYDNDKGTKGNIQDVIRELNRLTAMVEAMKNASRKTKAASTPTEGMSDK